MSDGRIVRQPPPKRPVPVPLQTPGTSDPGLHLDAMIPLAQLWMSVFESSDERRWRHMGIEGLPYRRHIVSFVVSAAHGSAVPRQGGSLVTCGGEWGACGARGEVACED